MHDIVTGARTVAEARAYYASEFLDARRKQPTPYMDKLHFESPDASPSDPDERILSEAQLAEAKAEGAR